MRYDQLYEIMASRAVEQGVIDLRTLVDRLALQGIGTDAAERFILDDLDNDGPIFGKFFRTLTGASDAATAAAYRQATIAGQTVELSSLSDAQLDALLDADPEVLEQTELTAEQIPMTWVAELKKTCYRCLPLHGRTYLLGQWKEMGFDPDTIHSDWNSQCKCRLVPDLKRKDINKTIAPLKRNKDASGERTGKKTIRGVTQRDIDQAIAARDAALESPQGRRILSMLGRSGA